MGTVAGSHWLDFHLAALSGSEWELSDTSQSIQPRVADGGCRDTWNRGRAGVAAWRDRSIARSGLWSVCERSRRADHQPALTRDSRDASHVAPCAAAWASPAPGAVLYPQAPI